MRVDRARKYILDQLSSNLSSALYYHGVHHVRDVVSAALTLAKGEGVCDQESLDLLETAALYHDSGFLFKYKGHEEAGCEIAREVLPDFEYNNQQIELICGMIMATKIPQTPTTHLEEILADADLDYLGRNDFEPIANTLFEELKAFNMITDLDAWNKIQVRFLQEHRFWTSTAKHTRNHGKQLHLENLLRLVGE
jgi:uncharacterized protein